jgi:hypothetical protein
MVGPDDMRGPDVARAQVLIVNDDKNVYDEPRAQLASHGFASRPPDEEQPVQTSAPKGER